MFLMAHLPNLSILNVILGASLRGHSFINHANCRNQLLLWSTGWYLHFTPHFVSRWKILSKIGSPRQIRREPDNLRGHKRLVWPKWLPQRSKNNVFLPQSPSGWNNPFEWKCIPLILAFFMKFRDLLCNICNVCTILKII